MSMLSPPETREEVVYPESDGKPIADNTLQFDWITTLKGGLELLFRDDPQVFVAGDLLWYPVKGDPSIRIAPDALVVLGRPKGYRGSYIQHREEGLAPQVVFEVMSPGNSPREMRRKHLFYQRYGVEEYYLYDPDHGTLAGWKRTGDLLLPIPKMEGWTSPLLGLRFALSGSDLLLTQADGTPIVSYSDLARQRDEQHLRADREQLRAEQERARAERALEQAEQERVRAEEERARAEEERARAEGALELAEQERMRTEEECARVEQLVARLRALGIDPDEI